MLPFSFSSYQCLKSQKKLVGEVKNLLKGKDANKVKKQAKEKDVVSKAERQQTEKPVESLPRAENHLKEVEERIQNQLKENKKEKRKKQSTKLHDFILLSRLVAISGK